MSEQNQTFIPTDQLAKLFFVKSQSIHHAFCLNGHYQGLIPVKLPNGRLGWPKCRAEALLPQGEVVERA